MRALRPAKRTNLSTSDPSTERAGLLLGLGPRYYDIYQLVSLNWFIILALACIGLAYTNPDHNRHHAALSPVFLEFIGSAQGGKLKSIHEPWTFLPKRLDYKNYFVFSTGSFPDQSASAQTPAEGILTVGMLGQVFVLFPKKT